MANPDKSAGFEDLGFAKVDHDRPSRCGMPEAIFGPGKTPAETAAIAAEIWSRGCDVLATRLDAAQAKAIRHALGVSASRKGAKVHAGYAWHERARCVTVRRETGPGLGRVLVICAGTADLPVAEEARVTAEFLGSRVETLNDVGVAGLHRLTHHAEALHAANVIVVAAGMEGALPSVVAGLTDKPVIAVPTSIGYGASFGGVAALLTMLNTCAAGVATVNIDGGFAAACLAHRINLLAVGGVRGNEGEGTA